MLRIPRSSTSLDGRLSGVADHYGAVDGSIRNDRGSMVKDISRREAMKAALKAGAYATPVVLSAAVPAVAAAATPAAAVQRTTTAAPVIIATTAAPVIIATTAAPVIIATTAAPVIIATTAAPAPTGDQLDAEVAGFLARINVYRVQNNATALVISPGLMRMATWMSGDMAAKGYFSHTDSLGRDLTGRLAAFGVTGNTIWGENLAAGDASAAGTFAQLRNSPEHDANMLRREYRTIGIGRVQGGSPYSWYWTIDFGNANG